MKDLERKLMTKRLAGKVLGECETEFRAAKLPGVEAMLIVSSVAGEILCSAIAVYIKPEARVEFTGDLMDGLKADLINSVKDNIK